MRDGNGWNRDAHVIDENSLFGGRLLRTGLNTPLSNGRKGKNNSASKEREKEDAHIKMHQTAKETLTSIKRKRRNLKKRPRQDEPGRDNSQELFVPETVPMHQSPDVSKSLVKPLVKWSNADVEDGLLKYSKHKKRLMMHFNHNSRLERAQVQKSRNGE